MQDTTDAIGDEGIGNPEPESVTNSLPRTIWQELETWAEAFAPWQTFILSWAVHAGMLSDVQVEQAYRVFLRDHGLAGAIDFVIPAAITGRPATPSPSPVRLTRMRNFHAINALPSTFELTFSNGLTVIYGRNGAGKSGVVRVLSQVCFSRMQQTVLPNIYMAGHRLLSQSANVIINNSSGDQEISFVLGTSAANADLKRITVFDTPVAHTHLVGSAPFGFKPAGFDVFPEMARVYGLLANQLSIDIDCRRRENIFIRSFFGSETVVSRSVASLNANMDLGALQMLAVFGDSERARMDEVQRQIQELQSRSAEGALAILVAAKGEIGALVTRLIQAGRLLTEEKRVIYRAQVSNFLSKTKMVADQGAESFGSTFFKHIGSPEWEVFLSAAQSLSRTESPEYPQEEDHCLLCHRPLDDSSVNLIRRFWGFLASDSKVQLEEASAAMDASVNALEAVSISFFSAETSVRGHVERLNPGLATQTIGLLKSLQEDHTVVTKVLTDGSGEIPGANFSDLTASYQTMIGQVETDITRLREQTTEEVLKALEFEKLVLQHKQILSQLLPEIESYVGDLKWIRDASGGPRRDLNTRPLTDKETQLFSTIIAEQYRERFLAECAFLDCTLPIELRTRGDHGQTIKSLSMQGGHSPDKILSEGEQRAIALADFLTEVGCNPASAGIVLDDPVNSQDHDRKEKIAERLLSESANRQVIIFTHDLVFLNMLLTKAKDTNILVLTHWIHRDSRGVPGQVSLEDSPDATAQFRTTQKAEGTLIEARAASGSGQLILIRRGMAELRRTIEEIVPHHLFKQVVNRWTDRVMVTSLKKISWDDALAKEIEDAYEELSGFIEAHTHTEERTGAPPEPRQLEAMINKVKQIIVKTKPERRHA